MPSAIEPMLERSGYEPVHEALHLAAGGGKAGQAAGDRGADEAADLAPDRFAEGLVEEPADARRDAPTGRPGPEIAPGELRTCAARERMQADAQHPPVAAERRRAEPLADAGAEPAEQPADQGGLDRTALYRACQGAGGYASSEGSRGMRSRVKAGVAHLC